MSITRTLLVKAIANPRLRAEFEAMGDNLDTAQSQLADLIASATSLQDQLQALIDAGSQAHSALLDAIAAAPDSDLGVFEKVDLDQVILREVDTADDACLVSRQNLMSYVGTGATGSRPTLSAHHRAVYFDTTLAANGKPVFWTGTQWVDATGASV